MKTFWTALFLLSFTASIFAQQDVTSATDYFNLGSATFIREDPERALAIVNEGLQFHPDDEPLLKLKALLEQQNDQQQQQQQDQQDQSQPDQPPENQDQPQEGEDQNAEENNPNEQPPPQENEEERQEPQASEMTEEEAEMVLDSLKQLEQAQREQLMQEMIKRQIQNMPPVEKDW